MQGINGCGAGGDAGSGWVVGAGSGVCHLGWGFEPRGPVNALTLGGSLPCGCARDVTCL